MWVFGHLSLWCDDLLSKKRKKSDVKVTHYGGASAGSLLAALLVLAPQSLEDGLLQLYELADELNSLPLGAMTPGFQLALG
uniref:PNPLA domain-containing protein n=1 Tax=Ditylenchus dipsaci TaxID=166011 RepID=A0A915D5X7_9BILA